MDFLSLFSEGPALVETLFSLSVHFLQPAAPRHTDDYASIMFDLEPGAVSQILYWVRNHALYLCFGKLIQNSIWNPEAN